MWIPSYYCLGFLGRERGTRERESAWGRTWRWERDTRRTEMSLVAVSVLGILGWYFGVFEGRTLEWDVRLLLLVAERVSRLRRGRASGSNDG